MKLFVNLIIFLSLSIKFSYAETTKIDPIKKLGSTLKAITGKSLNKDETQQFLSEFVVILEDERGDGTVTYLFDDRNYTRYKDYEEISTGAWRFTKTGVLRVFNNDIKLSWKIKLGKNNDNNINIKAKFDPIGKLYSFNNQVKEDFLSELNDHKEKIASEKKRKEQEKIDAQKKAEEEKAKVKAEKAKAEAEKDKSEEEKTKLEEEKAALEKEIAEQKKQLELEKLYIQLEPEFRNKCTKKALNNLFETGTPEYKTCILNKGPEKQLNEAEEKKQKAEEEKSKLEQEKKEAQKKAKAEKVKKAKEKKLEAQKKAKAEKVKKAKAEKVKKAKEKKLAAKQKAKEEEERKKQTEKQKFKTSGRLKCHMTYMANINTDAVKDVSNVRPRSYLYFNYDKTNLKIDWTNVDGSRENEVYLIKDFKEIWKEKHNGYTLVYEFKGKSSNKLHSEMILSIETWNANKALAVGTAKISYLNFIYECN